MTGHPRFGILLAAGLLSVAIAVGCSSSSNTSNNATAAPATAAGAPAAAQERGGQEETGPYELVENWPQAACRMAPTA